MALAFFLPSVQRCDSPVSPLEVSLEELKQAVWIVPPYIVAAILAATLVPGLLSRRRAGRSGEAPGRSGDTPNPPGPFFAWLSAGAIGAGVLSSLSVPWTMLTDTQPRQWEAPVAIAMVLVAVVCLGWTVHALRLRGWDRFAGLLGAHTLLALPLGIFFASLADALDIGGYMYLGATSALVTIQGFGWRDALLRRRHATLAGVAGGK
jgi:hypothetical protein